MNKSTLRTGLLVVSGVSFVIGLSFRHYELFVLTMVSLWIASWIRPS